MLGLRVNLGSQRLQVKQEMRCRLLFWDIGNVLVKGSFLPIVLVVFMRLPNRCGCWAARVGFMGTSATFPLVSVARARGHLRCYSAVTGSRTRSHLRSTSQLPERSGADPSLVSSHALRRHSG